MSRRLKQYRDLEGATAERTAKLLGVAKSNVTAIERGTRPANIDPSRLGYSSDKFATIPDMSEPLHRQRASVTAKTRRRNKEIVRLSGELLGELREVRVKTPSVHIHRMGEPRGIEETQEMAEECRYMLGLELDAPISNLTTAVERAGVALTPIHPAPWDPSDKPVRVDGLSSWIEDQPAIGLNPDVSGDRFRFTLAHELGHLLMHRKCTDNCETEANQFALALLIPGDEFRNALGDAGHLTLKVFARMKKTWGVSIAACIYGAHETGQMDATRYRSLQIQMSKWKKNEPGSFPSATGQLLPKLIDSCGGADAVGQTLGLPVPHVALTTAWAKPQPKRHLSLVRSEAAPTAEKALFS